MLWESSPRELLSKCFIQEVYEKNLVINAAVRVFLIQRLWV